MDKEEIKDYLKRADELGAKLTGEDKETYAWLIYGYNQCAKLLNETEQQVKKQKEVIDNIQKFIKEFHKNRNMFKWNEQDYIDVILKLEKMINEKEVE